MPKKYRPQIEVNKPNNLPVPITISYYNPARPSEPKKGETIVNFLPKSVRWRSKNQINEPTPKRFTPICRWYRRRRALNLLAKEHEKEKRDAKKKRQEEFENERLDDFMRWEQLKSRKTQYVPPLVSSAAPTRTPSARKQQVLYIKENPAPCTKLVKTRKACKAVAVKKYNHRQSITNKFVNCCYRICCQFYCYLTCLIFIIFSVICLV